MSGGGTAIEGTTGEDGERRKRHQPSSWIPFMVLICTAVVLSYADRTNIGIAIVPMGEEFHWSTKTKGTVLGAFFFGYVATQVMGGWLADRWGGAIVLTVGLSLWSVFTVVTPWAAERGGLAGAVAARVLLGLAEGVGYPAIHSMFPQHLPPRWLNAMVSVVNGSSYVGGVLALLASGPIAVRLGWPAIFWIFGGAGFLWLVPWIWWAFIKNRFFYRYGHSHDDDDDEGDGDVAGIPKIKSPLKPDVLYHHENENLTSPKIKSPVEKRRVSLGDGGGAPPPTTHLQHPKSKHRRPIPWSAIFTSSAVWALLTTGYCNAWGFWMILSWLPTFFRERFGMSLEDLGYLSVLPYAAQGIVGISAGFLGDWLMQRGWVGKRVLRTGAQTVAMAGAAGALLGILRATTITQSAGLVTLAMALNALSTVGIGVNHFDLAPMHAGTLYGIANTVAVLPGLVGVPLTGWMLEVGDSRWGPVFGLAAAHYLVGCVIWGIFGRVSCQIE